MRRTLFHVLSSHRLSLIEPGPVHTEFEAKMMEEVARMEFPGADADTVRYFKDVYIPSSIDIFEAMGQKPDDIAKVSREPWYGLECLLFVAIINLRKRNKFKRLFGKKLDLPCHYISFLFNMPRSNYKC